MIDTPNHGAITLDANLRSSDGYAYGSDTGYTVSLYQIGMPMDGHWLVNNAIGVSSSPAVDLARNQQRFWVPSTLQDGMAAEWRKAGALQLHASFGSPGLLTGIYVPTFEDLGGEQVSAGVQWNGAGTWSAAVQAVNAEDVFIASIVDAVDEQVDATRCGGEGTCQDGDMCLTHYLWQDLSGQIHAFLSGISLGDLVQRQEIRRIGDRQRDKQRADIVTVR